MALLSRLHEARAQLDVQGEDPWYARLDNALHGCEAISTAALLDFLRTRATTATARRLAAVMRSLQFIPIKSRRLMPGGRQEYARRGGGRAPPLHPIVPNDEQRRQSRL